MKLTEYKIGNLIEEFTKTCDDPDLTPNDISGINREKEFFEPSKQVGADTSKYKIVPPDYFACNLMHVGRDKVLPISLNYTAHDKIVSPAYTVFRITEKAPLLKEYFFLMMKSSERDRMFWFHTDSSIRDGMPLADFGNIKILLPPIEIQKKYVAIYHAMQENQHAYEQGLDDLKLCCDAFIENLRKQFPCKPIGPYLTLSDSINGNTFGISQVRGLAVSKEIIPTKADMKNVSLTNYKLVPPEYIAYVPDTSRRGNKISLAQNTTDETFLVSSISMVFSTQEDKLLAKYLMLFFTRPEFDRYARFHSWGSARENFDWNDMCHVKIPIPPLEIQQSIVHIYEAYIKRKQINERLKTQLKDICPILIRGSLKEAKA